MFNSRTFLQAAFDFSLVAKQCREGAVQNHHDVIHHRLEEFLAKQTQSFSSYYAQVTRRITPRGVHKLRTTVRRIRAVLTTIQRNNVDKASDVAQRLSELQRLLGAVREIDVLAQDAKSFELQVQGLETEHDRARRALRRFLLRYSRRSLLSPISKQAEAIHLSQIDMKPLLTKRLKTFERHVRKNKKKSEMHELRISLKKLRYVLEAVGSGTKAQRDLQGLLGRVHDLEVLRDRMGKSKQVKKEQERLAKLASKQLEPVLKEARTRVQDLNRGLR